MYEPEGRGWKMLPDRPQRDEYNTAHVLATCAVFGGTEAVACCAEVTGVAVFTGPEIGGQLAGMQIYNISTGSWEPYRHLEAFHSDVIGQGVNLNGVWNLGDADNTCLFLVGLQQTGVTLPVLHPLTPRVPSQQQPSAARQLVHTDDAREEREKAWRTPPKLCLPQGLEGLEAFGAATLAPLERPPR